jgi:putative SOS response-associated peptidase YedK
VAPAIDRSFAPPSGCADKRVRSIKQQIHTFLSVFGPARNLQPHYNIAPTDTVDVPMRWGLITGWWKKSVKEVPAASARARNLSSISRCSAAPSRNGVALSRRVAFTNGLARRTNGSLISSPAPTARLLGFGGLWERWRDRASSENILSCTIIVCGADEWMERYHDRMPVILEEKDFDGCLKGSLGPEALTCAAESALREWPVSPRLNRAGEGDGDPTIIEPYKKQPSGSRGASSRS